LEKTILNTNQGEKMKRILLIVFLVCAICVFASSQEIIFVSAGGNDNNSGLGEAEPLKTLSKALSLAEQLNGRITVLGTLDVNSETQNNRDSVFGLSANSDREIIITGKPGASGSEKAILSAKDSNKSVVSVSKGNIRFEHIEISNANGEGTGSVGVFVFSRMTLGQGAVVRDNNHFGILISGEGAVCTIDGGEVRNNNSCAVVLNPNSFLIMQNGTIADNKADMGAGVFVAENAKFEMYGGTIADNKADTGAGVLVAGNAKFEMYGGTITNNRADMGAGVVIMNNGIFEMTGGTITKNRATDRVGGVWVLRGGKFVQGRKAKVSGNNAAKTNWNPNVYRQ
jgi:hypothetical protein